MKIERLKEWWLSRAKLEDGHEVGAGSLSGCPKCAALEAHADTLRNLVAQLRADVNAAEERASRPQQAPPLSVHFVAWASQPDIQILCDGVWTQPERGVEVALDSIYSTEETPPRRYSFLRERVSCTACLARLERLEG